MERRLSRRACTERERHTYTDTWGVCVCVYMCLRAKRKAILFRGGGGGDAAEAEGYPVPQGGGRRIHHDAALWHPCDPWTSQPCTPIP